MESARQLLLDCGQDSIVAQLDEGGEWPESLLSQVAKLDANYPGGLKGYVTNARALLEASSSGANPMEGVTAVEVPEGVNLEYGSPEYDRLESLGVAEAGAACFVLVAGGLGERLGFGGIKLSLPVDLCAGESYLGTYCESILALQERCGGSGQGDSRSPIPLVIMTSDDTHSRTVALLEAENNFGLAAGQVRLVKQEKVCALVDKAAAMAYDPEAKQLVTKPHGHGDVHLLLHLHGIAREWRRAGKKWVVFFQDTNGLVFRSMCAVLGASLDQMLDLNSMCVPRLAKQEIGAITRLVYGTPTAESPTGESSTGECGGKKTVTCNTEYNQLGPLLTALGNAEGDVADPQTGFSPFPGNINQLVVSLESYVPTLEASQGIMEEFVNPKYKDATRTTFKKATRLECMMQDYAKVLPAGQARVGFTTSENWIGYSPAKNSISEGLAKLKSGVDPMTPATAEADAYAANAEVLRRLGCSVGAAADRTFCEIPVKVGPLVSLSPACLGVTRLDLAARFPSPEKISLSSRSALVVTGKAKITFEALELDGALRIECPTPGQAVTVRLGADQAGGHQAGGVVNAGWALEPLGEGEPAEEVLAIRGYRLVKSETAHVLIQEAHGKHVVVSKGPSGEIVVAPA